MEEKNSKPLFTLSVAAEILSVHPRTLMIYESQRLVIPSRTKTNRRRYSQKDIEKLQFIRYLTTKRNINLAGVRCVFELMEKFDKKDFDTQKVSFPDFPESSIF
ncbi:MAG: MerR family transcriptional regulator [Candidatus Woykebacteria bacterium]